jgi:hypothetical protein
VTGRCWITNWLWVYHDKDIRYLAGLQPPKEIHRELVEEMDEGEFYRHPLMNEGGEDGYWGVPVDVPSDIPFYYITKTPEIRLEMVRNWSENG